MGFVISNELSGDLIRPDYNNIECQAIDNNKDKDKNKEEKEDNNEEWDGTYIDVINFSLIFRVALQDLDKFEGTDLVYVHIGLYYDETTQSNLAKFTCLSGDRTAFRKIISQLEIKAGNYLTGLNKQE